MSNSNPTHTRHDTMLAATRGHYGPENQLFASCLNLYVAGAVRLLGVAPLETVDLVLSTDDAVIAFVAYLNKPSRKAWAAYTTKLGIAAGYHEDYAEKHS